MELIACCVRGASDHPSLWRLGARNLGGKKTELSLRLAEVQPAHPSLPSPPRVACQHSAQVAPSQRAECVGPQITSV